MTGNVRVARGVTYRVMKLAAGGWRIGYCTKLGFHEFPADPETDAAFAEIAAMTRSDQIDSACGDLIEQPRGPVTRNPEEKSR